jgi:hypothetical protein
LFETSGPLVKRKRTHHNQPKLAAEQMQTPGKVGLAQRLQRIIGSQLFKNMELTFWLVFICVPVFTGWLDYQSLPDEVYDPARHELLKSHMKEAWPDGMGTYRVPDSWRDKATSTIYSAGSFSAHRQSEAKRLGINCFGYGLIGCGFFAYSRGAKGQSAFLRAFRKSIILNAAVAIFVFWMT